MAIIESVYPTYVQKSKLFLYPALKINRVQSVSLIKTYMGLQDLIKPEDNKLIALYYSRDDHEFKMFESRYLIGNSVFDFFKLIGDDKVAYIFDFNKEDLAYNYQCILNGKYSKITPEYKKVIMEYYKDNVIHQDYINSFLNPEHYFDIYADLLTVKGDGKAHIKKLLQEVGELCSIPDFSQEILITDPDKVNQNNILLPLSGNQH